MRKTIGRLSRGFCGSSYRGPPRFRLTSVNDNSALYRAAALRSAVALGRRQSAPGAAAAAAAESAARWGEGGERII